MAISSIKRDKKVSKRDWGLWLAPALLVLGLIFVVPLLQLIVLSFHTMSGPAQVGPGFTFANFRSFLGDPFFLRIVVNTAFLGLVVTLGSLAIAFPLAYFLARTHSRWRGILLFLVIAPLLISAVVRNIGWFPILGENGLVNRVLMTLGLIRSPLELIGNYTGVTIGLTHALCPFMILMIMAVIQRVEPELEEAAANLGAGPLETFFRVLLPLTAPGVLAGSLLVFTMTISAYTTPVILGGGKVLVMATYIAQQFQTVLDYGMGACAAAVLMIVAAAITTVALRIQPKSANSV